MTTKLNNWKYTVPQQCRTELVRERIVNEIQTGINRKLTLITAPIGCGKTTAIRQWATSAKVKVAFLTIDTLDNDPALFFKNLLHSLQSVKKGLGEGIFEKLQTGDLSTMDDAIKVLGDQMGMVLKDFVLVLDDYHLIQNDAVHAIAALLLNFLPPQGKMVVCGEKDPPFGLADLRSVGKLKEIHPPHLSFTMEESQALFNDVLNLKASYGDISALVVRTKARAGLLKYAGFCLQNYKSLADFVEKFEKEERDEPEFLADILLSHLPKEANEHLPKLALTHTFSLSLSQHICNVEDVSWIEKLAEDGKFVHHITDECYRVEPMMRKILLNKLPKELHSELHTRAALWFSQKHDPYLAVEHAVMGENYNLAGQLLGSQAMGMLQNGEMASVVRWLNTMPATMDQLQPMISVCRAWIKIVQQDLTGIEVLLDRALAAKSHASSPSDIVEHVNAIREYLEANKSSS